MLELWLSQMDTFIVGQHTLKKFIQRVMKINFSTKGLFQRLIIEICAMSCWVLLLRQSHLRCREPCLSVYHSRTVQRFSSSLFQVGSMCGLGPDLVGIHPISPAARHRVAACSFTLRRGLGKVNEGRGHKTNPLFALPVWEQELLFPSMTFHTANAFYIFADWTVTTHLTKLFKTKKQKVATSLLVDKLRTQDSAGLSACRASRVLGLIRRHRVVDILLHMKRVSCASRPVLLVGFLRILWKEPCIARRFHSIESDNTCRVGCPDDSLITMSVQVV